jgi:long-chain acyl-CoA synthetase
MTSPVDVLGAPDPVAAVLTAHAEGTPIAVRTSGTTSSPRLVVRSTASWVDSFPAVTALTGLDAGSRLWLPGPLHASMNLFAAVHARSVGAEVLDRPDGAGHAVLTPAALATALAAGTPLAGMHLVVAGDRLPRALADRAVAAGARTAHYYGAAELSFLAWGTAEDDLRAFPGVELAVRDGVVWARSPYASTGYAAGQDGPRRPRCWAWRSVRRSPRRPTTSKRWRPPSSPSWTRPPADPQTGAWPGCRCWVNQSTWTAEEIANPST